MALARFPKMLFLGKVGGAAGRGGFSTSSAANMNGWQKVGSRKEAANDGMWVGITAEWRFSGGRLLDRSWLERLVSWTCAEGIKAFR